MKLTIYSVNVKWNSRVVNPVLWGKEIVLFAGVLAIKGDNSKSVEGNEKKEKEFNCVIMCQIVQKNKR